MRQLGRFACLAVTTGVLALGSAHVLAAGAPVAKTPVFKTAVAGYPAIDWTGWYGGIHAGYGWTRFRGTYDDFGDLGGLDFASRGFLAGGQIGYDWQSGRSVYGAMLDGSWANLKGSRIDGEDDTQRFKTNFLGSARVRGGVAVDDKLLFSSIGLAYSRNKFSVTENGATSTAGLNAWGLVTGLGMEWVFAPNWSFGADYSHYRFNKRRNIPTLTSDSDDTDFIQANSIHVVRVMLNYRPGATPARATSAPAANFAGAYAGLHGGYGTMRSTGTYDDAGDTGGFVLDGRGFAAGGQLGYNWQNGAWVYGIEIDGSWAGLSKSRVDSEDDTQKSRVTALASARGRLGAVVDNKMFYITGGVGYVRSRF